MTEPNTFSLAPFLNCCDLLHLSDSLKAVKKQHAAAVIFPVGDGTVAPLASGLDIVRQISGDKTVSCHVLLLTAHPERHIEPCAAAGCNALTIALESAMHHHRLLAAIRDTGMQAGLAINPASSLVAVDYLLEGMDHICLMGVEPGADAKDVASSSLLERITMLRENIRYRELRTKIFVCGGLSVELAGRAIAAGADIIGMDSSLMAETGAHDVADAMQKCTALWRSI